MSCKFKINVRTGDVEFEGSEAYVTKQIDSLPETLKSIGEKFAVIPANPDGAPASPSVTGSVEPQINPPTPPASTSQVPESFGEWMHTFPADIADQDKALVAGMFVQMASEQNDFKTAEINAVLKDHGYKLSNASKALSDLVSKKLLFQTRKEGKIKFLRVSKPGEARISELLSNDS